jgi:TolB protein
MDIDGSDVRRLTDPASQNSGADWSPDGSKIAFESGRDGNPEIYVMHADGGEATRLTDNPGDDQHPAWSPDGRRIAFNSERHGPEASFDIYTMTADGSDVRRLTRKPGLEEYPRWSPDGKRIAFTVGNRAIFVMEADGRNRRRVLQDHFFTAGSEWRPVR